MRIALNILISVTTITVFSQIKTFPTSEGFEAAFSSGDNVEFLPNWIGNEVSASSRIFQSSEAKTGVFSLGVTPTSSFDGEILIQLDLAGFENTRISFYAKSIKNGSTSTRPALVYFSTSIDGGLNFGTETQVGDDSSFPNLNDQPFEQFEYNCDSNSDNSNNVVVRIRVERGAGSGSSAKFILDDVEIAADIAPEDTEPPKIVSAVAISNTRVELTFSENIDGITAENTDNYSIAENIIITSASRKEEKNNVVELVVSTLSSGVVNTLTVNGIQDLSWNPIATNSSISFEYIEVVSATAEDIVINEFLPNPVNNSDDFIELYNKSEKFLDLAGWKIADGSSISSPFPKFILRPKAYAIIYDKDATIDYAQFGEAITIPSLTLNNDDDQIEILDSDGNQMAFLYYSSGPEDGISMELINPNDPCLSEASYRISENPSGSTPGRMNSIFDDTSDTIPPELTGFSFDGSLNLNFSEVMDISSLVTSNYMVDGLTISNIVFKQFPTSVELKFEESINAGQLYEMTVSGLADCSGNTLEETSVSFGVGRVPDFNELIITEIFFDPDPSIGLPEVEYVEILNTTNDLLSLESVMFSDATSRIPLPSAILESGKYYILTTPAGVSEFETIDAIGVSGFPSLNNGGEQLKFLVDSELIFSVSYSQDWHEEEKSAGGYSLEMKDITNPCAGIENWSSSKSIYGGTPGSQNSITEVIPDNFGPLVENIIAMSSNSIRVDFSENIDPISEILGTFTLSPAAEIAEVNFNSEFPTSLFIVLATTLSQNEGHTMIIENVTDCSGNEVRTQKLVFALPGSAEKNDIQLSEVLFNPKTNGVDFVELHNSSPQFISLNNWKLARITEDGVSDAKTIAIDEYVMEPDAYLAITTDAERLLNNYPKGNSTNFLEVNALATYANDSGNVVLMNDDGILMDLFHYKDDYHYNLLKSTDGVSLERISYEAPTNDPNNWRSAASTVGFATPGYVNSQALNVEASSGVVIVDPKIFIPGNSGSGRDFTTINYQFGQPGKFANVTIYDQAGRLIKNVSQGALLSTSGFLRWDGTNNAGQMARVGYYLVLFEIYESNGNTEVIKETVVVGRDF